MKYFRKKNQKSKESISLNDFFDYFSNLENDIFTCRNEESEIFCENHDYNGSSANDEFDRPISADEVLKALKKMNILSKLLIYYLWKAVVHPKQCYIRYSTNKQISMLF